MTLFEFSRHYCIPICAVLVPANLLATSYTLLLWFLGRQTKRAAIFATILAVALFFHVYTWWAIGVVGLPTFILPTLGTTCIALNFLAIKYPQAFPRMFHHRVE